MLNVNLSGVVLFLGKHSCYSVKTKYILAETVIVGHSPQSFAEISDAGSPIAKALQSRGLKIVSGGTDNHLMLLDLIGLDVTGKELQNRLDNVYITVNKNTVPGEPRSPFVTSGIRIGTPAVTTRGLTEADMDKLAELIYLAICDYENKQDYIRGEVLKLTRKYPIYE